MGTATTFDTYTAIKRLMAAGFDERQAEALSDTIKEAQDVKLAELATRGDLLASQGEVKMGIASVKAELLVIKWMLGLILLVTVIPVLKDFLLK